MFKKLEPEDRNPERWWTYSSDLTAMNSQDINDNFRLCGVGIDLAKRDGGSMTYDWGTCYTYSNWPPAIPEPEKEKRYKIKHH